MLKTSESPARFKATYTAWGTNHNFYNTEWQFSDSPGCLGQTRLFPRLLGSADQRAVSSASFLAFMRGNVGAIADPVFNQNFNPQFALPALVANVTRVDRGYTDSPSATVTTVFDDFPVAATNTTRPTACSSRSADRRSMMARSARRQSRGTRRGERVLPEHRCVARRPLGVSHAGVPRFPTMPRSLLSQRRSCLP